MMLVWKVSSVLTVGVTTNGVQEIFIYTFEMQLSGRMKEHKMEILK